MRFLLAVFCTLTVQTASAQEFEGSRFSLEYNQETAGDRADGLVFKADTQIAVGPNFSFGISLQHDDFIVEETAATLHALYDWSDRLALGAYYGQSDDGDRSVYGLELSTQVLGGVWDVYLGSEDTGGADSLVFGSETVGPLGNSNFEIFTDFELIVNDDFVTSKNELGVAYVFDNGPEVFVQVARLEATDRTVVTTRDYLGVGIAIDLDGVSPTFGIR